MIVARRFNGRVAWPIQFSPVGTAEAHTLRRKALGPDTSHETPNTVCLFGLWQR